MNKTAADETTRASAALDPMFPQIVKEANEPEQKLIGFIAYGLYSEARREWASEFKNREGRYPSESELRVYEKSWTSSRIEGIRNAAVQVVAAYADSIATQLETNVLRDALKGRFWREVGRWFFSAVLYSLAIVALWIALGRAGIDPVKSIRDLATPPPVAGAIPVIPGPERSEGARNPYPGPGSMDSRLAASRRPGMTAQDERKT